MVELGILGRLLVRVDGSEVDVGPLAQQRLLIRLGLAGPAGLSVDRLQDDLGVSATALRTAVSRVRKSVGPVVVTLDSGYRLDGVTIDTDRFEQTVAAARDLRARERILALDAALDLWRGRALDGVEDEPWAQHVAARLEEMRSDAREARALAKLALCRHSEAIAEARAVIGEHPLREQSRAVLMRALAGAGRATEALRAYQDYRTLLADEVGTEPSAELRALDGQIAAGMIGSQAVGATATIDWSEATARPSAGALPINPTSFVGRAREHDALLTELASARLVTLVGVGGVGKTRLAVEVARNAEQSWPIEVRFADLTKATHGDEVVDVVREALGVTAANLSADRLVETITTDKLLLVLDNCEHVISSVALLAEMIETTCPGISLLATSREGLGVPGERMYAVSPFDASGDALTLFADRARAVDQTFALDDTTRPSVEAICATLDGIPLAIELAAARARSLSVQHIADRLDDRFRLLGRGRRTSVDRHRTLAAALDWSFGLLSPAEQRVLAHLGVFARSFLLDDAVAMLDDPDAGEILPALVDKSLLSRDGPSRYRLLETIRHYCLDKLAESGKFDSAHAAHAEYVQHEMRAAVQRVHGPNSLGGAHRVADLFSELRAGVQWAIATDRLDLAMDLATSVESVFVLDLNLGLLGADVLADPRTLQHASALVVESYAFFDLFMKGTPAPAERAHQLIERHLAGEPGIIVEFFGPHTLAYLGDGEAALTAALRMYDHWVDQPDSPARWWGIAGAMHLTGERRFLAGWFEGLEQFRRIGCDYWIATLSSGIARCVATSDPDLTRELTIESLRINAEIGLPLIAQATLVTYVLLLDLDDDSQHIDRGIWDVIRREIANSRRGYRLRPQYYLVLAAVLAIAGDYPLAAEALAAYDALGGRSSNRTQALINVFRIDLDARFAAENVAPAPRPELSELPNLLDRIERALLDAVERAT